jgi:valyl-tRNA synthetase
MLAKRYDAGKSEPRWQKYWADTKIFSFNPDSGRPLYTIDTPPPTVSGKIHMGHVFSYVQAEALARFHRMCGKEVFYPFCFDDNGIPSERFTEQQKGIRAKDMPREEFIRLCIEVTSGAEGMFRDLWTRFGFSCDWDLLYTTRSPWVQRISQRSFLDLNDKDLVYRMEAPTLWCPECQTAVAQAETEDCELPSVFCDLLFPLADGSGTIPIATTRPELLPACVAVFVNPNDEKWSSLTGRKVTVPVFLQEVEILADAAVDTTKGSGVVMCCTFGDTCDIQWWREYGLDLRIVLDDRGHMNELGGFTKGMYWKKARKEIVSRLDQEGLRTGGKDIQHAVNVHERCGTPLEYLVNKQWFVRILDRKPELLNRGAQVEWYPAHFKVRFDHWVENLRWDWCISRQRYFGVPFPVWYCEGCGEPVFASREDLPVDPFESDPGCACPSCGGNSFIPETDVMDTWATSSLTPLINAKWGEEDERRGMFPMSLRPQAHDIIRTWAFYTIVKAHLHSDDIPWKHMMISGHALNPSREKMSKSKGNVAGDPLLALEQYSADELRYWACSSKLGTDVLFSEDVLGEGRRLVTKLWNATRFAASRLEDFDPDHSPPKLRPFDRWILARFAEAAGKATSGMREYEFSVCMREAETFFWKALCDNYLEIAKSRLYSEEDEEGRNAAQFALYTTLSGVLRLFAPVLVHVTEELYQEVFRIHECFSSLHIAPWPEPDHLDAAALKYGNMALIIIEEARRFKSESSLSMAAPLKMLRISASAADLAELKPFEADLVSVTRAESLDWIEAEEFSTEVRPAVSS